MKYPHILIAHREQRLPRIERILHRWGCRTTIAAGETLRRLVETGSADLLLVDDGIRTGERLQLANLAAQRACPLLELNDHLRLHADGLPKDILVLLETLQGHLVNFRRRQLRIRMSLPVLIENGGGDSIGRILNLSAGGLFLKNGNNQVKVGETVQITVPLLGLKKELELTGRVLYFTEATQENGFRQGLGIAFQDCAVTNQQLLRDYLRMVLEQDTLDAMDLATPEEENEERIVDGGQLRRARGPSMALCDRRFGPSY